MYSSSAPATGPIFLKGLSETSARATGSPPRNGQLSDSNAPTLTSVSDFALAGRSNPPDPRFHAYRPDLADVALAGRVIASHYAEPIAKRVVTSAPVRTTASADADMITELEPNDPFTLLDDTLGWAWGYAGRERRVGYIRSEALGA